MRSKGKCLQLGQQEWLAGAKAERIALVVSPLRSRFEKRADFLSKMNANRSRLQKE